MYELRPYQAEARQAILSEWDLGHRKTLLVLPTGCHASGSYLLLADGSKKKVDDIHVGDRLLGPDGQPRNVLYEQSGSAELYLVVPIKGKPFAVTGNHRLTLVRASERADGRYPCKRRGGEVIDVSVNTWMTWSENKKHLYKLLRCGGIEKFPDRPDYPPYLIDPYFLGILLGDGSIKNGTSVTTMDKEVVKEIYAQAEKYQMNVRVDTAGQANTYFLTGNPANHRQNWIRRELKLMGLYGCGAYEKFVPRPYLCGNRQTRLNTIAGLLDTDGSVTCNGYDFISASARLADDLAFMCRSVGLAAYVSTCRKKCQGDYEGTYYRVSISGDCHKIPCRVAHKQVFHLIRNQDVAHSFAGERQRF